MLLLNACSGGAGGPLPEAPDTTAPTVQITFPPSVSLTEGTSITVRGTASDASEITVLRVNGAYATTSDGYANWSAVVPLAPGPNTLTVESTDIALNTTTNAAQVEIEANGPRMDNPVALVFDSTNNRVLVLNENINALVAVDLVGGARTMISNNTTPDGINPFGGLTNVTLDIDNNRVLVTDYSLGAVLAVDLTNGTRTILSDDTTPNGINPFSSPTDLVLDSANNRVLVADPGLDAVLAVDLASGARTIVSDNTTPDGINSFRNPGDLILNGTNSQLLVLDGGAVMVVDLVSGQRVYLSR